jgi:NosR/NirI family transcriptional regulator, nitrous oxide reductase regulator
MNKKVSKFQIFRTAVQIAFLILLPGLFTLTFSQLGRLYSLIIKGNFSLSQAFPQIITAATVIAVTIFFGRFFCSFLCAFGTFNDLIYLVSKNIFKVKFRINPKIDAALKYVKYFILIFIVIIMWTMGIHAFQSSSPWDAFAQLTQFPQAINDYTAGFIILAFIAIGAAFIERFFCRYLCPLGAVFSIVSKLRMFNISKPNDKCGKCRLCTNSCSMGIPLYKSSKVTSGECINCFKCLDACPRENTAANIAGEDITPAFASSLAIAAFAGIYSVNNLAGAVIGKNNTHASYSENKGSISQSVNIGSASTSANSSNTQTQQKYKDGTYTGTGNGFRPGLEVSVTVKSGKISDIQITNINDTPGYYDQPVSIIPQEIIKAQSTNVDAVSGATRSSNGIMMAVEDALQKAVIN